MWTPSLTPSAAESSLSSHLPPWVSTLPRYLGVQPMAGTPSSRKRRRPNEYRDDTASLITLTTCSDRKRKGGFLKIKGLKGSRRGAHKGTPSCFLYAGPSSSSG